MSEFMRDAAKKLIITEGDPSALFADDPLLMLLAVREAAESGFDLHKGIYEAIVEKEPLLSGADADSVREGFEAIITAEHAGKGLKMLAGTGLMNHVIGDLSKRMTRRAMTQFTILAENIDKTKRVRERRLALFYICFDKKPAMEALALLNYSDATVERIIDAFDLLDSMNFISGKLELKKFIAKCGAERYEYLDGLSKAQRLVYDLHDVKIMGRRHYMEEIIANSEAVLIEDLAIDEDDIVDRGVADRERTGKLLEQLLELVHKEPRLNNRHDLITEAQKLARSGLRGAFPGAGWLKSRR